MSCDVLDTQLWCYWFFCLLQLIEGTVTRFTTLINWISLKLFECVLATSYKFSYNFHFKKHLKNIELRNINSPPFLAEKYRSLKIYSHNITSHPLNTTPVQYISQPSHVPYTWPQTVSAFGRRISLSNRYIIC